jgi:hypothetical protein
MSGVIDEAQGLRKAVRTGTSRFAVLDRGPLGLGMGQPSARVARFLSVLNYHKRKAGTRCAAAVASVLPHTADEFGCSSAPAPTGAPKFD